MQGVNVKSEIGNLKKVILHRPGDELLNLTPNTLEELLFDDIPFLPVAQEEHDAFANILRGEGVEVVYLDESVKSMLFAGKLDRSEEITPILDVLRTTDKLSVDVKGKKIVIGLK